MNKEIKMSELKDNIENKHVTKEKILEWYCREGWCGTCPDCDTRCPNHRGENPCFNYNELKESLEQLDIFGENTKLRNAIINEYKAAIDRTNNFWKDWRQPSIKTYPDFDTMDNETLMKEFVILMLKGYSARM